MTCVNRLRWRAGARPLLMLTLLAASVRAQPANPPAAYGPTPTERQLAWHAMELYGFVHFTVNTFTDKEWGYGDESPAVFNPSDFDADQIARAAREGGMAGLILTAKHHDGFCLWPSAYTEHSVKNSPWRGGQGDVVRELADACRAQGLQFGVYLSPWDRNHPSYGRPEYITYYRNQLTELCSNYGPLFTVWFDGANGGDGFYGGARETRHIDRSTYYDWPNTWAIVRRLQPMACMFSDAGPDFRWIGNERGIAGETCWATLDMSSGDRFPGGSTAGLTTGQRPGTAWLPPECDVSIRPGWFYHASEDDQVKSPRALLEIYYQSVGRGACLNLNLPPDPRGQIHDRDVASLKAFHQIVQRTFGQNLAADATLAADHVRASSPRFQAGNLVDTNRDTYWSTDDGVLNPEVVLSFERPTTFDVIELREYLPLGQRIEEVACDVWENDAWREVAGATSIGNRRLIRIDPVTTSRFRLRVTKAAACPALSQLGLYQQPELPGE